MHVPRYPALYQINTRVFLSELSQQLGRPASLDDIPDEDLQQIQEQGFHWIWLLGVWQTGEASRSVSRSFPDWQEEFRKTLPDLRPEDITGSCFAIRAYEVAENLGGRDALERLRRRLQSRGMKLMLDFVPNHVALDHPWLDTHPDFFIQGTEENLSESPERFIRIDSDGQDRILAHGRDPYSGPWPDTLQLNYSNPGLQESMLAEMLRIGALCDGLRCDMAMLLEPEVFQNTWGLETSLFWPDAIDQIKNRYPGFVMMAEVYWDMEYKLLQQGFDYAYDKRFYDRVKGLNPGPIRDHLKADVNFQAQLVRFLENHDEQRAAKVFTNVVHKPAAVLTYLNPGMRFFHQGQLEGKRVRISPHLGRGPVEAVDWEIRSFYEDLLRAQQHPAIGSGDWRLLDCRSVGGGNVSWENIIGWTWYGPDVEHLLVFVNMTFYPCECFVHLPFEELRGRNFELADLTGDARYERTGDSLLDPGLYLYMQGWGYHVFEIREIHP